MGLTNLEKAIRKVCTRKGIRIGTFRLPVRDDVTPNAENRRKELGLVYVSPNILRGRRYVSNCPYDNSRLEIAEWRWQGERGRMILPRASDESFDTTFYECPNCHRLYDTPVSKEVQRRIDEERAKHPIVVK